MFILYLPLVYANKYMKAFGISCRNGTFYDGLHIFIDEPGHYLFNFFQFRTGSINEMMTAESQNIATGTKLYSVTV